MSAEARKRRVMEVDLRQALRDGGFRIDYQPIFDVHACCNGLRGAAPMETPDRRTLPPSSFIPLAEETGFIGEMGEWVLAKPRLQPLNGRRPLRSPSISRRSS